MTAELIYQCPRCELRFRHMSALDDHLAIDHAPEVDDKLATHRNQQPDTATAAER